MIGRNGERRSGISAQAARHDDDDIKDTLKSLDTLLRVADYFRPTIVNFKPTYGI